MKYRIENINVNNLSDDVWNKYYLFKSKIIQEISPDDPVPLKEYIIQKNKQIANIENRFTSNWFVFNGQEEVIGSGELRFSIGNSIVSDHVMTANLSIDKEYRRQGIGKDLLREIINTGLEYKKTLIETEIKTEVGLAFAKAFGGVVALTESENRVKLSDIDWDLMDSWRKEGQSKTEGVRIETFQNTPDDILEEFAALLHTIENFEVPQGDLENRENWTPKMHKRYEEHWKNLGFDLIYKISREKDGKMSSCTCIRCGKSESYVVRQDTTGVLNKYRGRGLGKWLKADMAFYIKEKYPNISYISTGNADENAPMRSINERMGYKFHKAIYDIKLDLNIAALKLKN